MNRPFGSCRPWSSSGVTRSPRRRRGLAERLLNVLLNWLPVNDGMALVTPSFESPVLAPVTVVCATLGVAVGDLVVGNVDGDIQDRFLAAAQTLGPAQSDVESFFSLDHLRGRRPADGRLHNVFDVGNADAPACAFAWIDGNFEIGLPLDAKNADVLDPANSLERGG